MITTTMKNIFHWRVSFVCLLLISFTTQAAITARLDRSNIYQDETFHLIFESDSDVDGSPDFSVLPPELEVLSSSSGTNMSMVNGSYSMKRVWDLTLMSSASGIITIPSINFGKEISPALRIEVKKNADDKTRYQDKEVFIEVEVDRKNPYVESQIIFTARLLRTIEMHQMSFSELKVDDPDAIIINLGNVPQYRTTRNGKNYVVNEIRYAIFPQRSGKLTIPPLRFQGMISQNNAHSLFDSFFKRGEVKRMRSQGIGLNVKPRPDEIQPREWLPTRRLFIDDDWSSDLDTLKAGEPVTRTITLNASGFTAEQLPDLDLPEIDGLKQYPDQPLIENTTTSDGVVAKKQFKIAIIPTREGAHTIPEIRIPWWNTGKNRLEYATLPEVSFDVTAAATALLPPVITKPTPIEQSTGEATTTKVISETDAGWWPWLSLLLATGWAMSVIYLWRYRRPPITAPVVTVKEPRRPSTRRIEQKLRKACEQNNANGAKEALIEWGRCYWQDQNINSIGDVARRSNKELAYSIGKLNDVLYGMRQTSQNNGWDPEGLMLNLIQFRTQDDRESQKQSDKLAPLYP